MTVAQEYMRNSRLVKESGNRLPEFLETLPNWPKNAARWSQKTTAEQNGLPALTAGVTRAVGTSLNGAPGVSEPSLQPSASRGAVAAIIFVCNQARRNLSGDHGGNIGIGDRL
jgi:hypothetical protein